MNSSPVTMNAVVTVEQTPALSPTRRAIRLVNQASLALECNDPAEGRLMVDTITASRIASDGPTTGLASNSATGLALPPRPTTQRRDHDPENRIRTPI